MLKRLPGPMVGLLQVALLTIAFGLSARSESGAAAIEEVDVVVFELMPDGQKGRRIYRDTFYLVPTEKRSAAVRQCGMDLFNYQDKVEALDSYRREGSLVIVYKSSIDPVSKNTTREELCRIGQ